jgi:hypothetical protein
MRAIEIPLVLGVGILLGLQPGCRRGEPPAPPADASKQPQVQQAQQIDPVEACVEAFLTERGLDRYGNPADTMYMGGTPLFDERTGESKDRLQYIFERHPEARAACAPDGGEDQGEPLPTR